MMPRKGQWFEQLPGWGIGEQGGPPVGPGPAGPSSQPPRPAQPGESPDLLPTFAGPDSAQAQQNRAAIRHGDQPRGDDRLPDYLKLDGPITYNDTLTANIVDLGTPPKGWRWVIRQLLIISQTLIDDPNFTGVRAHFYIGQPQPNTAPSPNDWAWDLLSLTVTDFSVTDKFTSDSLTVLENQHLFVSLTHGTNGYHYLPAARVKQVSDRAVRTVTDV